MINFPRIDFICRKCGGLKCVGEKTYLFGKEWRDVTCIKCGHTVDIEVSELEIFFQKLSEYQNNYKKNHKK